MAATAAPTVATAAARQTEAAPAAPTRAVATATPENVATAPTPTELPGSWALAYAPVPWAVDCDDDIAWNGYRVPELGDACVPGLLTQRCLDATIVADFYGALSSYAPGVMEAMERRWGIPAGRGVALMSCRYVGATVWLRVPGVHTDWQGPYFVADCSAPAHRYVHLAVQGLAAEVGASTAAEWGIAAAGRVDVHMGPAPPGGAWHGVNLARWWAANRLEWEKGWLLAAGPGEETR